MKTANCIIIGLLLAILFLMFRRTSGYGDMPTQKKRGFMSKNAVLMGSSTGTGLLGRYEGGEVKFGTTSNYMY
jgi:hypothetical protein